MSSNSVDAWSPSVSEQFFESEAADQPLIKRYRRAHRQVTIEVESGPTPTRRTPPNPPSENVRSDVQADSYDFTIARRVHRPTRTHSSASEGGAKGWFS